MTQGDGDLFALIIEDSAETAFIMERAFKTNGFETHAIYHGDEAMSALDSMPPHVILLDLHLPYATGLEILEKIRSIPALSQTEIIIATANPSTAEKVEGDVFAVLIKPISYNMLCDVAREVALRFRD